MMMYEHVHDHYQDRDEKDEANGTHASRSLT